MTVQVLGFAWRAVSAVVSRAIVAAAVLLPVAACGGASSDGNLPGEFKQTGDEGGRRLFHGADELADCGLCEVSEDGRYAVYLRGDDVLVFDADSAAETVVAATDAGVPRSVVWDLDENAVWLIRDRRCSMISLAVR